MKDGKSKYFIALVPPEPLLSEVMDIKNHFKENYQSKGALRSPAHITLHMPFDWSDHKQEILIEALHEFSNKHHSISIQLNGFGSFEPRVIFIQVQPSEELNQLQKVLDRFLKIELNLFSANYRDLPFHPHMTVAFRDLKKSAFVTAWEEFKDQNFVSTFRADSLTLLKHDGERWQIFKNFDLNNTILNS